MKPKIDRKFDAALYKVPKFPLIGAGDDIGQIIYQRSKEDGFTFENNDIVVIASKIVSKAENAIVRLSDIEPGEKAQALSRETGRDARLCQVYLNESAEILNVKGRMIITRDRLGYINTSANVDRKNIAPYDKGMVVLLPKNPDQSSQWIRSRIQTLSGKEIAVIICDSFGKPDRFGTIGVAIGIAGIRHLEEKSGQDLFGNPANTCIALVDEIAAAASMLMGQTDEGCPVVIARGIPYTVDENASITRILEK